MNDNLFRGEEYLSALLLGMVIDHCTGHSPAARQQMTSFFAGDPSPHQWLDSYDIPANAWAMLELDGQGLIEIVSKEGWKISAKVLPKGEALAARLRNVFAQ